eukprot:CAMPEP_0197634762 /NCGR_PEP_ID=MMETSP1338-20131121/10766_1 /TAXON_ID=43686 ORGANISM="Pelagodinium beii, Strain RCC1491" /NCGR_SAMPLE_ID=MMETSP1338 /ASSEMBLY_ACC=CAM_ASM_000754 /LENGTH=359 /DNA_ID=CAMNT_0043206689 /DNA_START=18 /DNA_END=1097 /DNA_ORIENTATION=-
MPQQWYCAELWRTTPEVLDMPTEQRIRYVQEHMTFSSKGPFPAGAFDKKAAITTGESALVLLFFFVIIGCPILLLFIWLGALIFGSWRSLAVLAFLTAALAFHPLPDSLPLTRSRFTIMLYRYFSYRFMWVDDAKDQVSACKGWIGAGAPHGVLPIANFLSMPAINAFTESRFLGGGASVTMKTPFLRYLTVFGGAIDVSAQSLSKATSDGICVGIVPDGIAGIFQQRGSRDKERVALKNRMGLARLSLRKGIPIVPAYSLGNTACFTAWYDSGGIMQAVSRRLRASIFVFWGRFGLPLPHRANITMLIGPPILPKEVTENPSQETVAEMHKAILHGVSAAFDLHKDACGWGDRTIEFV